MEMTEEQMKLQEGDYVTNLTKEQWDELIAIEDHFFATLPYCKGIPLVYNYSRNMLLTDLIGNPKTELSFADFRQRAINTFNS